MGLLKDSEAERIRVAISDKHGQLDQATLVRWAGELLDDRRARSAIIQNLCRRTRYVRQRFAQAHRYLDGLLAELEQQTTEPWAGKVPCPICGAPTAQARAEYRPNDPRRHVAVYEHADGTVCEEKPASPVSAASLAKRR